jgi:hypothetical protein
VAYPEKMRINLRLGVVYGGKSMGGVADALAALIKQLFGASEEGAFYIPQPIVLGVQSLFQDAAGTVDRFSSTVTSV